MEGLQTSEWLKCSVCYALYLIVVKGEQVEVGETSEDVSTQALQSVSVQQEQLEGRQRSKYVLWQIR